MASEGKKLQRKLNPNPNDKNHPFPCDFFLQEFAFLIEEYEFILEEVIPGRGVVVVLRKESLGVGLEYDMSGLPGLFFVMYEDHESKRETKEFSLNERMMGAFNYQTPQGKYKMHDKIDEAFFLMGAYYQIRHAKVVGEEVKERIREYAQFVKANYDEIWAYVEENDPPRPKYFVS